MSTSDGDDATAGETDATDSGATAELDAPLPHAPPAHMMPSTTTIATTTRLLISISPIRGYFRGIRSGSTALPIPQ